MDLQQFIERVDDGINALQRIADALEKLVEVTDPASVTVNNAAGELIGFEPWSVPDHIYEQLPTDLQQHVQDWPELYVIIPRDG